MKAIDNIQLGVQEPPQDYRIYNKRRPDGTFPPISGFFDKAAESVMKQLRQEKLEEDALDIQLEMSRGENE